jgi:hypothetical protein
VISPKIKKSQKCYKAQKRFFSDPPQVDKNFLKNFQKIDLEEERYDHKKLSEVLFVCYKAEK